MTIIDNTKQGKLIVIPAGDTNEWLVKVSPGRRVQIGVEDPIDGTFKSISKILDPIEFAAALTHTIDEGMTAGYNRSSVAGFHAIGIQFTAASSTDTKFEILECKLD